MYTILICDDEKDIVSALKIYLENDGYQTREAYNGEEAVEIIRNEEIHLAILDIMMPKKDGISAMEEIGIVPGKDIIIITVDGEQAAIDELKAGRVNCVVECTPYLGNAVMDLALRLVEGEEIPRILRPEEGVFTEYDNLTNLPARGY